MHTQVQALLIQGKHDELSKLDLCQLQDGKDLAADIYAHIRGSIICGNYKAAAATVKMRSKDLDGFTRSFLELQLTILSAPACSFHGKEPWDDNLKSLAKSLPKAGQNGSSDDWRPRWIRGEFHLIFCIIATRSGRFREALDHAQTASEYYVEAGLPCHTIVAHFYEGVAANHLNFRETWQLAYEKIKALHAKYCRRPGWLTINVMETRMRANDCLDREDFPGAFVALKDSLLLCVQSRRWRDFSALVCPAIYALGRAAPGTTEVSDFIQSILVHRKYLGASDLFNIEEMADLFHIDDIDDLIAAQKIKRWQSAEVVGSNLIFLLSVLCLQLMRLREDETLLNVARLLRVECRNQKQAMSLVDGRYFEALALYRLGLISDAERTAQAFLADACLGKSLAKEQTARDLLRLILNQKPDNRELPTTLIITYYKDEQRLVYGQKDADLRRSPVLAAFLEVLAENPISNEDSPDGEIDSFQRLKIEDLFWRIYKSTYRSDRHERRLHSLIERARRLLADRRAIVRMDGYVYFADHVRFRIISHQLGNESISGRRKRLVEILESSRHPLTIGEIKTKFPNVSRRSLQSDLQVLSFSGIIKSVGTTVNRRYMLSEMPGS